MVNYFHFDKVTVLTKFSNCRHLMITILLRSSAHTNKLHFKEMYIEIPKFTGCNLFRKRNPLKGCSYTGYVFLLPAYVKCKTKSWVIRL